MGELPFLLVYGAWLWLVPVALAALGACVHLWTQTRHRGRRSAAWGRTELTRPAREPLADGARAVVSGVLVVEGDTIPDADGRTPVAALTARADRNPDSLKDALDRSASLRAPTLALRTDDGAVVHLDGPVVVLAGSREVWTGSVITRLPKVLRARMEAADEAGAAMLSQHHVVLASVKAGDRVLAFGRIVARQDIRTVAVRWSLTPAPEASAGSGDAVLAAVPMVCEGAAAVSGPLPRSLARASALSMLGMFAVVLAIGEQANLLGRGSAAGAATVLTDASRPLAFRSVSASLVAATTPFRRKEAALRIAREARRFPHDDADLRALAGVWSYTAECHVGVEVLARSGRYDEATTAAWRCGTPAARWVGAQVAQVNGDNDEAARFIEGFDAPPAGYSGHELFAAIVNARAGRFTEASRWMRRVALVAQESGRGAGFVQAATCASAALAIRAGDETALETLRNAAVAREQGWRCALLLADTQDGVARVATLDDAERRLGAPWGAFATLTTLLRAEAAPRAPIQWSRSEPGFVGRWIEAPGEVLDGRVVALERAVLDGALRDTGTDTPAARTARVELNASLAMFEALAGSADDARRYAAQAAEAFASSRGPVPSEEAREQGVEVLRAAVELRVGTMARAQALQREANVYSDRLNAWFGFLANAPHAEAPWTEGLDNDGPELLPDMRPGRADEFLARESHTGLFRTMEFAIGVRRLASDGDRARVASWLSWGDRPPCWRCRSSYQLAELSHIAMAARALDRPDVAQAAERALARGRRTLLKRDRAVVAMFLETM